MDVRPLGTARTGTGTRGREPTRSLRCPFLGKVAWPGSVPWSPLEVGVQARPGPGGRGSHTTRGCMTPGGPATADDKGHAGPGVVDGPGVGANILRSRAAGESLKSLGAWEEGVEQEGSSGRACGTLGAVASPGRQRACVRRDSGSALRERGAR